MTVSGQSKKQRARQEENWLGVLAWLGERTWEEVLEEVCGGFPRLLTEPLLEFINLHGHLMS